MIRFKRLKIKNFRSISELEIEFPEQGLVLIKGPNGSGKTSIFNALFTCLYNRQVNGRPASNAVKKGTKSCEIISDFQVNGQEYQMVRYIGNPSNATLYSDGQIIAQGNKIKDIVEELVPPELLKLSMLQNLDIKQLISSLSDVTSFVNLVRESILSLKQRKLDLEKNRDSIKQTIESLRASIDNIENEITQLRVVEKSLLDQMENFSQDRNLEELLEIKSKQDMFKSELSKRIANIEKDMLNELQNRVIRPCSNLNAEKIKVQSKLKEVLLTVDNRLNSDLNNEKLKINNLTNEINHLNQEIEKIDTLIREKSCYVCHREISDEDIPKFEKQKEELLKKITEYKQKIGKCERNMENFKRLAVEAKEAYKRRAEQRLQNIEEDLKRHSELEREITSNVAVKKQKVYEEVSRELGIDLNLDIDKLIRDAKNLDRLKTELETTRKTINNLKKTIDQTRTKVEKLSSGSELKELEEQISQIDQKINVLDIWTDTKLLKKLISKQISDSINIRLQKRYNFILKVKVEIDDKDEIHLTAENIRGETIPVLDCSNGEGVICKLNLYAALRDSFSDKKVDCLFLDEFIDSLDEENSKKAIDFLRRMSSNAPIFLISHREDIQDEFFDEVINMEGEGK